MSLVFYIKTYKKKPQHHHHIDVVTLIPRILRVRYICQFNYLEKGPIVDGEY